MTRLFRYGSIGQLGHGVPFSSIYANRERWHGLGSGKTAVITGANAGLGFFSSLALAASGAKVVLACRAEDRAQAAMTAIRQRVPEAELEFVAFDSTDPAAAELLAHFTRSQGTDIVVANAGMIHTPSRRQTSLAGQELTMATNFSGHARLAGALAEHFRDHPVRFIAVGSMATRLLVADPANLNLEHGYSAYRAYSQSKAALQALAITLDHRFKQLGWPSRSIAVHPGYSISGLTTEVPGVNEPHYFKRLKGQLQAGFAQGKQQGAVCIVEAALNPGVPSCERGVYFGPKYVSKGELQMVKPVSGTRRKRLQDPVWELFKEANGQYDPFTP